MIEHDAWMYLTCVKVESHESRPGMWVFRFAPAELPDADKTPDDPQPTMNMKYLVFFDDHPRRFEVGRTYKVRAALTFD